MGLSFTEEYRTWGNVSLGEEQVDGVNFLLSRKGAILSFQTGLGKTLTVCVAGKILLDSFPKVRFVIVCPVKAKKAFKRELFSKMGYTNDDVGIIATDEMVFSLDRNKIFLATDTNLDKLKDLVVNLSAMGNILVLAVDEAHKLADKGSKYYNDMLSIRSVCSITWGITATPLLNGLDSLYNIVNFCCPGFFGKKTQFDNRYIIRHLKEQYVRGGGKRKIWVIDGYKNLDELNTILKKIMIIRSIKYDLRFTDIYKNMTDEEYDIYKEVSSGILSYGDDERNFSQRMHDLQRFIDRSYSGDESIQDLVARYNTSGYSTKEDTLINTVKMCLSKGFSTIIYCDYKETVSRLHKVLSEKKDELGLKNIYEVSGSIRLKVREAVEEKIGNRDIVLITSAGTESINLQRCNCIIMYDTPFSVKQSIQAIGRVCRRDSLFPTQYCMFITMKDTIDEYKYRLFQNHLNLVQQSVGVGTDVPVTESYLMQDSKDLQRMKDEFLWAYKNKSTAKKKVVRKVKDKSGNSVNQIVSIDVDKKSVRKDKKYVKENLFCSTVEGSPYRIASNKFLIEPTDCAYEDVKVVSQLFPERDVYEGFLRGEVPFTLLRSKYLDFLRSDKGKLLVLSLRDGILKSGTLVLVGNTQLPEVLKDEVLASFGV